MCDDDDRRSALKYATRSWTHPTPSNHITPTHGASENAAARCFTNRPPLAILLSVTIALMTVWAAIAASYEFNWPIGFFVGTISATDYAIGRSWMAWGRPRSNRASIGRRDGDPGFAVGTIS